MPQLLLATNNPGKRKEIQALLAHLSLELLTPADLGLQLEVAETGSTYRENAALKATAFARAAGMIALADDSGLEVAALDDAPGLYSARFANKPHATDADRRAYLLQKLEAHPRPWLARFRCWVALANPAGDLQFAEGLCPGEIIPEERGAHGFGYDPIFLLPPQNLTMAELPMAQKNLLSHRARAIRAALPVLEHLFQLDGAA